MKVIVKNKRFIKNVIKEGCEHLKQEGKIYWGGIEITNKEKYKEVIENFYKHHIHKGYSITVITPFINIKQLCEIIDNS